MLADSVPNNEFEYPFQNEVLKLLIVEDHPVYLEGLLFALESLAETVHIKSVTGLQAAKDALEEDQSYDLVLLDLSLSDGLGLTLLRYIQVQKLFIPVAILSGSEQQQDVSDAMDAGASGYISKANGRSEIIDAIQKVLSGELYLPNFYEPQASIQRSIPPLTPRQYEVLQLLAEGLPNKMISRQLHLTEHTVKTHIKTLFSLFEVHNRTECASVAAELGLIEKQTP